MNQVTRDGYVAWIEPRAGGFAILASATDVALHAEPQLVGWFAAIERAIQVLNHRID